MVKGYIYRHWIVNDKQMEKSYIGLTIQKKPQSRWGKNGRNYMKHNKAKFARAIKKYGWDNFKHEVIGIVEAETKEELIKDLKEWEVYYIEKYDSYYNGYNSTKGGEGVVGFGLSGEDNPFYGKTHTEDTRRKISESRKGKFNGKDNPFYGKTHTDETKKKISEKQKGKRTGKDNSFYGKTHTNETKQRISEARKKYRDDKHPRAKAVICLETGEVFGAKRTAERWCGVRILVRCCRNSEKYSAGKHPETGEPLYWMYYEDYLELHGEDKEVTV